MNPTPAQREPNADHHGFPPTGWSTIHQARSGSEEERFAALERLCQRYEPAVRRTFHRIAGPQAMVDDLVQDFFAEKFLRPQFIANLEREGGRFRDFIRVCIRNFHRTQWKRDHRRRSDLDDCPEPSENIADPRSPDDHLDAEWARQLLALARDRLHDEARKAGQEPLFAFFCLQLDDRERMPPLATIARDLGRSENAIAVALHRMRERFGWLIHDEIRQTIPDPSRWREERDHLLAALKLS